MSDSIQIYGRKHSKNQRKKVTFGPNCEDTEKERKEVKINFSQLIKSTYFGVSFSEMSLAKK